MSREASAPDSSSGKAPVAHEFGEECGGKGGVPYLITFLPPARIRKLTVWHRDYVDGFQLETEQGVLPRIGGTGLHHDVQVDTFEFGASEVVTGISVEFWQYVDRIVFQTNFRRLGPFGGQSGVLKRTISPPASRPIVGLRGRHWKLVDSIQLMVL